MNWTKTYNKYKDTKLMKEFEKFLMTHDFFRIKWTKKVYAETILIKENIKDIYGYILVFAETKGWIINIRTSYLKYVRSEACMIYNIMDGNDYTSGMIKNTEQAMLWCADKFFEVAK